MAKNNNIKDNIIKDLDSNGAKIYFFVKWFAETPNKDRTEENYNDDIKKNTVVSYDTAMQDWLFREDVQNAIKNYLKSQRTIKMLEIYEKMYEKSLGGDVNACKWVTEFYKSDFFESKSDEVNTYLQGISLPSLGGE